jgi:starch-binding outer membrane protein, SusD/RagB family
MSYSLSESTIDAVYWNSGAPLTWQGLYSIILNSNTILSKLELNDVISQANKDVIEAETLFHRAYAYYYLTNLWGDVPYYRENLPISEIQALPRTDKKTIRDEILVDLQKAQVSLPSSINSDNFGKVSKWVAATVMVKIYLIQNKWQQARDKSLEIINDSPHKLLDEYASVFRLDKEYNEEIIWSIDFGKDLMQDHGWGNDWVDHFSPRIRDEPKESTKRAELSAALAARNEGFTGYGLAIALPDFVKKFPLDDLRRASNITTEYLGYELNFPYISKRWNLDQINSPRGNHADNKLIFRLADVYLMAAEAENELNGPTSAYQYINKVRERAFEPDQPLSGLSKDDFRLAMYDERKWELAAEGERRMDLIRWGILLDVVKKTEYRVYDPAPNIKPHHVLLPIPTEEFILNPALLESDPTNNGYR